MLLTLSGNNLGERQKELNVKVNEAVANDVTFEAIKNEAEHCDVDKLFKIDLASKYKNIEYLIEVLKSGDTLYISRALKSIWMYDDEFSHIFNTDYLHHNIFPFMSLKMKKKLLTTLSFHIRNVDRATEFCNYCMKTKLTNLAQKFVLHTSEDFKLDFLRKHLNLITDLKNKDHLKHFIGNSFDLADAYLDRIYNEQRHVNVLHQINYLYTISDEKYLNMLEKHLMACNHGSKRFGLRISKDIMLKHKNRVLANPSIYINLLNKGFIVKYSTPDNVKTYVPALLLDDTYEFWDSHFWNSYEYILNIIPVEEKFRYMQNVFHDKYPNEPFEMCLRFHTLGYYRFMTQEEKNKWALAHLASEKEILGSGNDYKWYKYVNFDIALEAVKKLIMITSDNVKRSAMIYMLIESAKTHRDLEKLFKYFYVRHNNEMRQIKENFAERVDSNHKIFDFDKDCWEAFNKIYQNVDVYSTLDTNRGRNDFKMNAFIYHVINKIDLHDALIMFIDQDMYIYTLKNRTDLLSEERVQMVYQYIFEFYMAKIYAFDSIPYDIDVKDDVQKYIRLILDLLHIYGKSENDIPEVVMKFMKLNWDDYSCHSLMNNKPYKHPTQEDLIGYLKKDSKLIIENWPTLKEFFENRRIFNVGHLLKKMKVYFPHDISKEYLNLYISLLESKVNSKVAHSACYGIFHLADNNFKADFMAKYAPTESKIIRSEMDESLLNIQEAICGTLLYSRPPVPLHNMLMYMKGDYVPRCLCIFNSYFANLPVPLRNEFIEALLDNPLSIQKHGVRLAFVCYNAENLRKLILSNWKKTKNVSFRLLMYKTLYKKITKENEETQTDLFETLRRLTLELHQDDDEQVFQLLTSRGIPQRFLSGYIHAGWKAVSALPVNNTNLMRKADFIQYMHSNIRFVRHEVIKAIVEEFIKDVYKTEQSVIDSVEPTFFNLNMWDLTVNYIMYVQDKEDLKTKLELTKLILNQCLSRFNLVVENTYVMRKFTKEMLQRFLQLSLLHNFEANQSQNEIFETIRRLLHDSSFAVDMYMMIWSIEINMATRKALFQIDSKIANVDTDEKRAIVKSFVLNFGKDCGNLIQDYTNKRMYFNIFFQDIRRKYLENISTMARDIKLFDIGYDDLLVFTSLALMEFKTNEINIFALEILPSSYSGEYGEEYRTVLNKLKGLNNLEIRCKFCSKFINEDFEHRDFLQL